MNMNNKSREDAISIATFAGGCFWCVESDFEKVKGVLEVVSGYSGGQTESPTYEQVSSGSTGHVEAVRVEYNPNQVSYADLLEIFWHHVDPTDPGGQFVDRGQQYRTVIFYHTEEQKLLAEKSKSEIERSGRFNKSIVTEIVKAGPFYPAEQYHQDYYKKHPIKYRYYRSASGRDKFLNKVWQATDATSRHISAQCEEYVKPSTHLLQNKLTPLQYEVTQEEGTESPFENEYWDNKREGIYVDVVSGEPLFSSTDKYDSGTGWPSFTKPIISNQLVEKVDRRLFSVRTEVRSRCGDSHLGHVFKDGPLPTGLRYCINSAALRFIPKEALTGEGYGEYVKLFEDK